MIEGGAVGAVPLVYGRLRPRGARVRREPIDVERLAAEFTEPRPRTELEIVATLEAEVRRMDRTGTRLVGAGERRPAQVQTRAEHLQFEQTRLPGQHHLVAERICATTAV